MPDYFNTPTLRRQILDGFENCFKNATVAQYGTNFPNVKKGPLGQPDSTKRVTVGIVAGDERKSDLYPLRQVLWDVNVEFSVTAQAGEVPSDLLEKYMGVVNQIIIDNNQVGLPDIVVMINDRRSTVDQFTYADKTVMGMITFEVNYRHNTQSVYSEDPSV